MAEPSKLLTMGERLRAHRKRLDLTLDAMGDALSSVVWELHQRRVAISGDRVSKWERGVCRPTKLYREAYRVFLDATDEELGFRVVTPAARRPDAAAPAAAAPQLDLFLLEPFVATQPVDAGYIASLRSATAALVTLDNLFGGDDLSALAVRAFRTAHRRLGSGQREEAIERDLLAATGELAEVAAWMLYDADNQRPPVSSIRRRCCCRGSRATARWNSSSSRT